MPPRPEFRARIHTCVSFQNVNEKGQQSGPKRALRKHVPTCARALNIFSKKEVGNHWYQTTNKPARNEIKTKETKKTTIRLNVNYFALFHKRAGQFSISFLYFNLVEKNCYLNSLPLLSWQRSYHRGQRSITRNVIIASHRYKLHHNQSKADWKFSIDFV